MAAVGLVRGSRIPNLFWKVVPKGFPERLDVEMQLQDFCLIKGRMEQPLTSVENTVNKWDLGQRSGVQSGEW